MKRKCVWFTLPSGKSLESEVVSMEETREQTMKKIEHHLPTLTDKELRMVSGFIRGIKKERGDNHGCDSVRN